MPVLSTLRSSVVLTTALLLLLACAVVGAATTPDAAHTGGGRWVCLAHYESTHRWHVNTGNGHYGGLQFSLSTWRYYGGPNYSNNTYPHKATRAEQIVIAKRTALHGWGKRAPQGGGNAWPDTWHRCN